MPIVFYCPDCGQKLRIGDEFAGKAAACVRCNRPLRVPETSQARSRHDQPPESERFDRPESTRQDPPQTERPTRSPSARTEPPATERHEPPESTRQRPPETERLSEPEVLQTEPPEPETERFEPETGRIEEPETERFERRDVLRQEPAPAEPEAPPETAPIERRALPSEREKLEREAQRPARRAAPAVRKKQREAPLVPPRQKIDFEDLIDMTSMVDVVFFLLIFFLVTSMKAIDSSIPMPAPDQKKASTGQPKNLSDVDSDEGQIVVRIDRNDTITVEGAEVRSERDLMFKLRDLKLGAGRPDKLLVIGHGDASHGTAVMVLDAGRDVGIDQVRLAVADENE